MAYHSLPKQYNINEIKGFLHSNSIGVDTLQVHSRLFFLPKQVQVAFPIPCCLTMVCHSFVEKSVTTNCGGFALEHSSKRNRNSFWILFFVQLTVQLSKSSQIYVLKYFISEHV